jgi:hypothetical protein
VTAGSNRRASVGTRLPWRRTAPCGCSNRRPTAPDVGGRTPDGDSLTVRRTRRGRKPDPAVHAFLELSSGVQARRAVLVL